jgi:hypothetical protein
VLLSRFYERRLSGKQTVVIENGSRDVNLIDTTKAAVEFIVRLTLLDEKDHRLVVFAPAS